MDTELRKNIAARDAALVKTGRVTRVAAVAATAGSLVLMAGFAHLIPPHLPHVSVNGPNSGGSGSGTGTQPGNATPAPGGGAGPAQATSGGS
jgi:hypothetical protein